MTRQSVGAQSDPGHSHQSPRLLRSSCAIARRKSRRNSGILFFPLELFPHHEVIEQSDLLGRSVLQLFRMLVSEQVSIEFEVARVEHLASRAVPPAWPIMTRHLLQLLLLFLRLRVLYIISKRQRSLGHWHLATGALPPRS